MWQQFQMERRRLKLMMADECMIDAIDIA